MSTLQSIDPESKHHKSAGPFVVSLMTVGPPPFVSPADSWSSRPLIVRITSPSSQTFAVHGIDAKFEPQTCTLEQHLGHDPEGRDVVRLKLTKEGGGSVCAKFQAPQKLNDLLEHELVLHQTKSLDSKSKGEYDPNIHPFGLATLAIRGSENQMAVYLFEDCNMGSLYQLIKEHRSRYPGHRYIGHNILDMAGQLLVALAIYHDKGAGHGRIFSNTIFVKGDGDKSQTAKLLSPELYYQPSSGSGPSIPKEATRVSDLMQVGMILFGMITMTTEDEHQGKWSDGMLPRLDEHVKYYGTELILLIQDLVQGKRKTAGAAMTDLRSNPNGYMFDVATSGTTRDSPLQLVCVS